MYAELKCKTNFSFLRGASSPPELIQQADSIGLTGLAISDCNGVYGLPRAFEAARHQQLKTKLISGAELTIKNSLPITLLATSRAGYGLMCRLLTQLHAGKAKNEGFLDFTELLEALEAHATAAKGLIFLPTLEDQNTTEKFQPQQLALLRDIVGPNIYLPLCRYLDGFDSHRTKKTIALAREYQIPIVAHNDVHYHHPERRFLQDALTCIRETTTIDEAGFALFGNAERYLKNETQMLELFKDLPEAVHRAGEIAAQCNFSLSELKYTYPREFIPPGYTAKSYLEELVMKGATETYRHKGGLTPAVLKQIRYELDFLNKRSDEHYFLTVHDIVSYARSQNIYCQGRGSAANSIVCYVLGITSVDPIDMNLLFDRFMNEGRKDPPDIDVDFEHDRREEVIQYIYRRFGRARAAMVTAVRTYRSKSALLELSKALGIAHGTLSASELQNRLETPLAHDPHINEEHKHRLIKVLKLVDELKTFPRHLSIHSGGFVLSDDDLCEIVPIEPARMPGRTIVQWDKDDLEAVGLMKIDVLSIGFLAALHRACDLAGKDWRYIPSDDKATYQMIQRAETHGTFQIESRAQMAMLPRTLPQNYYDLVVEVALVRPSPSKGGMVQPYLKGLVNKRKGIPLKLGFPPLEKILARTCGVPIFQEQIMQISIEIAKFTPAEADQLRRSLSQMRTSQSVNEMGQRLHKALTSKGIPKKFADDLFLYIQGYAHYGFPESHAASYASIAYKSAYMKCHHPAELLIGLINSQPMGFYPIDTLINEAKRSGVTVLPVHPLYSKWDALLEAPKTVRMGLRNLKGLKQQDVDAMVEQCQIKPFVSLEDFIARTQFQRHHIETLSMAGFFASFGLDRRHSFWKSIEFSNLLEKTANLSLFDERLQLESSTDLFQTPTLLESMTLDYRKMGYSLEGNLMKALRQELPHLPKTTSLEVKKMRHGASVEYAGILTVLQRPPPAMGTAFITLEDDHGSADIITRKEVYEKYKTVIRASRFLIVRGQIQTKGRGLSIIAAEFISFAAQTSRQAVQPGEHTRSLPRLGWSV